MYDKVDLQWNFNPQPEQPYSTKRKTHHEKHQVAEIYSNMLLESTWMISRSGWKLLTRTKINLAKSNHIICTSSFWIHLPPPPRPPAPALYYWDRHWTWFHLPSDFLGFWRSLRRFSSKPCVGDASDSPSFRFCCRETNMAAGFFPRSLYQMVRTFELRAKLRGKYCWPCWQNSSFLAHFWVCYMCSTGMLYIWFEIYSLYIRKRVYVRIIFLRFFYYDTEIISIIL